MKRRVVVTGLGMVTPLGTNLSSTWDALVAGTSGVSRITSYDPGEHRVQIAAEVRNFDIACLPDLKEARRLDRGVHFALAATLEAVRDAKLEIDRHNTDRVGVIFGTALGGIGVLLGQQKVLSERGPSRVSPFMANGLPDAAPIHIAIAFDARGPNMAVVTACASGSDAIGAGLEAIRRRAADVVLAGGADALIVPLIMAGFEAMRCLASDNDHPQAACKPFDLHRDGFVVGEGAATLVLEAEEYALARGARIYAELAGYGTGNDAFHIAMPAEGGTGVARVMHNALQDANVHPEQVGYINAHGTGTILNDKFETAAIRAVFGGRAYTIPVSSVKSMTGHLMGASGALEAAVTVLAMCRGVIPPTINFHTPDPHCDLDYVPNLARKAEFSTALSNSVGLGGHNAALVFRRI